MNKQLKKDTFGHITGRGIEWTDWTWNPIAGCTHGCEWSMPDGTRARCYADVAATRYPLDQFYPEGFEHHYFHERRLKEVRQPKSGDLVFPDSMSDLMRVGVPRPERQKVYDAMASRPDVTFQILTKNAPQYLVHPPPINTWLGVSSPPDFWMHQPMSEYARFRYMEVAVRTLRALQEDGYTTWMSFEPLTIPMLSLDVLRDNPGIDWAVIGAASDNRGVYHAPDKELTLNLLQILDAHHVAVFFKGNMEVCDWIMEWREEFPNGFQRA